MITYTFYLKSHEERSLLILAIHENRERKRISTGITELSKAWDSKSQTFTRAALAQKMDNEILNRWKNAAAQVARENDIVKITLDEAKNRILSLMGKIVTEKPRNLFLPFYQKWATTSTSKRTATRQTLNSYRLFAEFAGAVTFKDVTYSLCEDYVEWMHKRGLQPNTRGGHIKNLKAAMNDAYNKGLHTNIDYRRIRKETEEVDNVYLNDSELLLIEEAELSGYEAITRDLFVIGCLTAMRFSDYSRLTMADVIDGYIHSVQVKTKERVVIPAHPKVLSILNRYGSTPKISQQKFNANIKNICRDCGIVDKVPILRNGKAEYIPKYKLVSSHTARRTAATNMYKAGIPAISIMKITGHRTESNFLKYIKISKEENAEILSRNSFFK